MLTRGCHWTSSWGSSIQPIPSILILSLLVPQSSQKFSSLEGFPSYKWYKFYCILWSCLTDAHCIRTAVVSLTLSVAFTCSWLLWKCDWRFQWVSPFSWVMTCNDVARFWYHCVSGRLSCNITQVYTHMHVRAHTHTHTLCECGCLSLKVSVATLLGSVVVNKQLKKFCDFRNRRDRHCGQKGPPLNPTQRHNL